MIRHRPGDILRALENNGLNLNTNKTKTKRHGTLKLELIRVQANFSFQIFANTCFRICILYEYMLTLRR